MVGVGGCQRWWAVGSSAWGVGLLEGAWCVCGGGGPSGCPRCGRSRGMWGSIACGGVWFGGVRFVGRGVRYKRGGRGGGLDWDGWEGEGLAVHGLWWLGAWDGGSYPGHPQQRLQSCPSLAEAPACCTWAALGIGAA